MATFTFEEASCTSLLPAVWPLRMRVSRSAIGSVMLIRRPSPARLRQARNLAAVGDLPDLHARQAELAVHAPRAAGNGAALALARRARVPGHGLQLHLRCCAVVGGSPRAADQLFQLCTLRRVLLRDLGATLLALDHVRLRHSRL